MADKGVQQGAVRHYLHDAQGGLEALEPRMVTQARLLDAVRRRINIDPSLVRGADGSITEVKVTWDQFVALAGPHLVPTQVL